MTTDLADRYGAPVPVAAPGVPRAGGRPRRASACRWLGWTAWFHGTPDVRSELVSFEVTSDHEIAGARRRPAGDDGVEASCRLRAFAEDHTTVGELAFTPVDGANEVVIRTERRATTVEKLGCTAPGQPRPR